MTAWVVASAPEAHRLRQRLVAAARAVGVDRGGIDPPDARQQPKPGVVELRDRRPDVVDGLRGGLPFRGGGLEASDDADRVDRCRCLGRGLGARGRHECGGTAFAEAEARRALPADPPVTRRLAFRADGACQSGAHVLRAQQLAGDVVADVGDGRRLRGRGEQGVEGRDAVRLGGRDRQPAADVVQRPAADPAEPFLGRLEDRQQQVPMAPRAVSAARDVAIDRRALAPVPAPTGRADQRVEERVDRGALLGRGRRPDDMEVHSPPSLARRRGRGLRGRVARSGASERGRRAPDARYDERAAPITPPGRPDDHCSADRRTGCTTRHRATGSGPLQEAPFVVRRTRCIRRRRTRSARRVPALVATVSLRGELLEPRAHRRQAFGRDGHR